MPQETRHPLVNLGDRPDLLRKLEKYGIAVKNVELTGEELDHLIRTLDNAIEQKKRFGRLDIPNVGNITLFVTLSKLLFIAMASLAVHITRNGIGPLPVKEENERKIANLFAFELMLRALMKTGVIKNSIQTIVEIIGTNEKGRTWLKELLELLAIVTALLAATKESKGDQAKLIESFRTEITEKVNRLEKCVQEGIKIGNAALFLQQSKMALQRGDTETLLKAYKDALALLGITEEEILNELKEFESLTELLVFTFTSGLKEVSGKETAIQQV